MNGPSKAIVTLRGVLFNALPSGCWLGQDIGKPNYVIRNGKKVDLNFEHSSGYALDVMVVPKVGQRANQEQRAKAFAIVNWCIENANSIGLRWVIWDYYDDLCACSYNPSRGAWKRLYRGGVSEAHADHVHIYLDGSGSFNNLVMRALQRWKNIARKEVCEVTKDDLHKELNENPVLNELVSRVGMVATLNEKLLKELIEEVRQLRATVS